MSNEVYDEFCKASIPNLTTLDRQVLGHYCTRFNEDVRPPRAWPSRAELMRITGAHSKSISRSLGRLVKRRLIIRITLASDRRGLKAEFAINRPLIRSHIKVTEQLPNTLLKVTKEVVVSNCEVLVSNLADALEEPSGYAKRIKPKKPKNVDTERFNEVILKGVPTELRSTVSAGWNIEELLNEAESLGLSHNAIREHLNVSGWQGVKSAGAIVIKHLKALIDEGKRKKALANQVAETDRAWDLAQVERERLQASPENVKNYISEARESIQRNSP